MLGVLGHLSTVDCELVARIRTNDSFLDVLAWNGEAPDPWIRHAVFSYDRAISVCLWSRWESASSIYCSSEFHGKLQQYFWYLSGETVFWSKYVFFKEVKWSSCHCWSPHLRFSTSLNLWSCHIESVHCFTESQYDLHQMAAALQNLRQRTFLCIL